ncbi:unnamed protein product [Blepharisma stoltei]|uniref:Uncharacterized protein n=1 Tax=Blepharisma stoltei TaxID=1481888 RepID=A0AAU9IQD4_9CILI|nr:unnamed protein product [Blepharisma stoltei]
MSRDQSRIQIRSSLRKHSQRVVKSLKTIKSLTVFSTEQGRDSENSAIRSSKIFSLSGATTERNLGVNVHDKSLSPDYQNNSVRKTFSVSKLKTLKIFDQAAESKRIENSLISTKNTCISQDASSYEQNVNASAVEKRRRIARNTTLKLNIRAKKHLNDVEEDDGTGSEETFFKSSPKQVIEEASELNHAKVKLFKKHHVKEFKIQEHDENVQGHALSARAQRVNWLNSVWAETKSPTDFRIKIRGKIINSSRVKIAQERASSNADGKNSEVLKGQIEERKSPANRWTWKGSSGVYLK